METATHTEQVSSPTAGTVGPNRIRPADIRHRREFREFVLADATDWHREHLGRLYDLWEEWNEVYFRDGLVVPYVLLTAPPSSHAYGDCSNISAFGGRSQIRIRLSLLTGTHPKLREGDEFAEGRFRFVADVLLHELIHQWHFEVTGWTESAYHGHGPAFRDECNRIGAELGLPTVRTSKKRGPDKHLPSCAQWPHNVRPEDYYLGALVPDSGDTEEEPTDEDPAEPIEDPIEEARRRVLEAARIYGFARDRHETEETDLTEQAMYDAASELEDWACDLILWETGALPGDN